MTENDRNLWSERPAARHARMLAFARKGAA